MIERDRLDALYDTTLSPRLAALEDLRLSTRQYIVKSGTLVGIPAAIFVLRGFIRPLLPSQIEREGWH